MIRSLHQSFSCNTPCLYVLVHHAAVKAIEYPVEGGNGVSHQPSQRDQVQGECMSGVCICAKEENICHIVHWQIAISLTVWLEILVGIYLADC